MPHAATVTAREVERVFRAEYARAVTVLVRNFGDLDLAEEAVQEAFLEASARWPTSGIPPSPAGWIITTARNRIIDRLRREATRDDRHAHAMQFQEPTASIEEEVGPMRDDLLRLVFTCCHPSLAVNAQVALTLRLLGGLTTPEIARAFLVPEPTLAQRLVRAKAKIRDAGIPFRIPESHELPERLAPVLHVVYLIFNEGYSASSGDALIRDELCNEALRLARLLVELLPHEPEVLGLLALLLLAASRTPARITQDGELVLLADQDRERWDRSLIDEGQSLVRRCLAINRPGPYQLQAAIQAVHSDAARAEDTDWKQIVQLYDHLLALTRSPIVALNRAIAVAEVDGAQAALALIESLPLAGYHVFHTARAELCRRAGRLADAAREFRAAIVSTQNAAEQRFLQKQLEAITPS